MLSTKNPTPPQPVVSIIIPMYGVERFIEKCIRSIQAQTLDNIEIIAIDDGSPDASASIVKNISLQDPRVRLIRTKNQGVSAARNLGIENAQGEYIAFVDGDDWLASDFSAHLVQVARECAADFVVSSDCFLAEGQPETRNIQFSQVSTEYISAEFLYPRIEIGCWNKLYKRDLLTINKIRFPTNFFMGEGLNFIVDVARKSKSPAITNKKVYFYRQDNSESATTKVSVEKFINAIAAIDNINKDLSAPDKEFITAWLFHRFLTITFGCRVILMKGEKLKYLRQWQEWTKFLQDNWFHLLGANVSIPMKLRVLFFGIAPAPALHFRHLLMLIKRSVR